MSIATFHDALIHIKDDETVLATLLLDTSLQCKMDSLHDIYIHQLQPHRN